VYSISFAHAMSFHEHGFYSEHQYEFSGTIASGHHHHEHHIHHSVEEGVATEHINHNDHCDDGIFDLIACVLSDLSSHNHTDCQLEHQPNEDTKRLTNQNTHDAVWLDNFENSHRNSVTCLNYNYLIEGIRFSLIDNSPLRGPPIGY